MIYLIGATSNSIDIFLADDTGLPVTGKVAADFPTLKYSLAGAHADVAFPSLTDLAALTTAYASGGVKERGNGYYRLDVPDGAFAAGGVATVRGEATGLHVICERLHIVAVDPQTAIPAVKLADGVAHGGTPGTSTATFAMQLVNVTNPSGDAIHAEATGGNGNGFVATGNGFGSGCIYQGGASAGDGFDCYGGVNGIGASFLGSPGFLIAGNDSEALNISSTKTSVSGIDSVIFVGFLAGQTGDCVRIVPAGTNVHGINIQGGDVSGDAIHLTQTSGKAIGGTGGINVGDLTGNLIGYVVGVVSPTFTGQGVKTDPNVAAIKAKTDNLPAAPAAVGSAMTFDLTQAVPTSNTAQTVGDCLNAARADGFGKWVINPVAKTLTLYASNGTTVVRTFTLDSVASPTQRV